MDNYFQIRASIDTRIIGKSEAPLTIEINDRSFSEQSRSFTLDVSKYFEEKLHLYDNFPNNLEGSMYQKNKSPIDIMNVMPFYMSLQFVVSEKVANIFDSLLLNRMEYHLEKLTVKGINDKFYFLFIPMLKSIDYIDFSQSVFIEFFSAEEIIFGSYDVCKKKSREGKYFAKHLFVPFELQSRNIINLQIGKPFYNERIREAFQKENVIGYEVISGGDSKIGLHFI